MALPPKWYQFLVSVFASLGSLTFGYDLGVIAQVIGSPSFKSKFGEDPAEIGAVVSVFTGGAFCGAGIAGWAGDRFGRRLTILIGAAFFLLGGTLQTIGKNIAFLMAGRTLAGVGVGVLCMIIPVYQGELCHPDIRGRVTALQQFMLGIGALAAAWISYGSYIGFAADDNNHWRVILLHAHGDVTMLGLCRNFAQIEDTITIEREGSAKSYAELFTDRSCFRASSSLAPYSPCQMTGLVRQFLTILFIDKTGRRFPLIGGNLLNAVCFIICHDSAGQYPPLDGASSNIGASWGFIAMTWLYNFSFSATCGPLSMDYPAEIFDNQDTFQGVCNFTNAIFFWAFLPETARRPLEEMRYLFTEAPLFVPRMDPSQATSHDLERRIQDAEGQAGWCGC
ncbi:H+/hexose cotransporter 1 [Verticillium dahliae]|nr:H+/hexose cotransporter 1 [Verticillium dahliae]